MRRIAGERGGAGASLSGDPVSVGRRLGARRSELEQTALARVTAIGDPATAADPAYVAGLREALAAALDYGLAAIADPGSEPEPVPVQLFAQARLAARNGVGLEAVLRRYAAGHSLLADSLLDEAAAAGVGATELKGALHALASRYDCIVAAVSEEYGREAGSARPQEGERRRYSLVRRLLAGESLDPSGLGYDLAGHHLAIVAAGTEVGAALERLGRGLDRCLLLVRPQEQAAWAWFGGRRPIASEELDQVTSFSWPEGSALACGCPGEGPAGWSLSHRQAGAALPVAQRDGQPLVHYLDVATIASALQDDLLLASLRGIYLEPLAAQRDGGTAAKRTLRAYFEAAGNVSSAAASLASSRTTVRNRLLAIEDRYGRPLASARGEIELALRLDELDGGERG